jgi:periplasmic protein TonB
MYNTIINPTWLSVVFENRNQQYGAFQLRKEYEKNLIGGLLISHASLAGFFGLIWVAYALAPKAVQETITTAPYKMIEVVLEPNIKIEPPKDNPLPKQQIKSTANTNPVVVPDEQTTTTLATQEELEGAVISTVTTEGEVVNSGNPTEIVAGTPIETITEVETVLVSEVMPAFPSEYGSIGSFLGSKLRYPNQASANGITGKVYVEFVIDENGNMILPKIVKGLGYGCDEEVLRILAMMPQWSPGKMNGRGVRVKMTMPVNFKLSD